MERRFGKHRGVVADDADPMGLARLKVELPQVFGPDVQVWAMPCVPFAGSGVGVVALPPIGAGVWVEFEEGDLSKPIWSGAYWSVPADVPSNGGETVLVAGAGGSRIRVGDGSLVLESGAGAVITLDADTITISNGAGVTIDLAGDQIRVEEGTRRRPS